MNTAASGTHVGTRASDIKPRAFSLELTKGCNLRCGYCYYADREDAYDPATAMSTDVAERSIELLLEEAPEGEPIHLHLFGGEPLLNMKLLEHVVEYGRRRAQEAQRPITFEVTTNGTRFSDRVIEFLNRHEIHVGVSFDGPPEVQDSARPSLGGSSHALAEPGIRKFLASRSATELAKKTHCSVVVTRRELDLVKIVDHLENLGFESILLTPATDLSGTTHGLREEDLPQVLDSYKALAERFAHSKMNGHPTSVVWFDTLMKRLLSGQRKTSFCGGGRDYLGVAADGAVSLCYRFYQNDEYAMGDVFEGVQRSDAVDRVLEPLENRPTCSTCWARNFCGGGCHHENLITTGRLGDPNPVTCEILRHSMDLTLDTWGRLTREGQIPTRSPIHNNDTEGPGMTQHETTIRMNDKPVAKPSCHVREVAAERVVYEPTVHEVAFLNATAAWIFEHCDGDHTVQDLLDAMIQRYSAPEETLTKDLLGTLSMLHQKGLLCSA